MLALSIENIIRLAVAFLLGGAIGIEREISRKPAGLRTHILISLSAALFTLVSTNFLTVAADPTRIIAHILTGMGFVGAGVIISTRGEVRGVTTAASLWVTAAIGIVTGLGGYGLAAFSTLLVLITLWVFRFIEKPLNRKG